MRRLLSLCLLAGAIHMGGTTATILAVAQGGSESQALQADNSLQAALKSKDAKAAGALLAQDFSWTNEAGATRKRADFLKDVGAGGAGADEYTNVKGREYGQLAVVTGLGKRAGRADTFFARVWVKRPAGWLLLTHQDTPILSKGAPAANTPSGAPPSSAPASGDCENPCKTLPYVPKTEGQKALVNAYQAIETAVVSHDAKTWADHVADEFVGVGRKYYGEPDTKALRVGQIGIVANKVVLPKMLSGEAYAFGDAGILIADHQPAGEPPYRVIRVFVNRDGRWQLFHRQETTIQKAQ